MIGLALIYAISMVGPLQYAVRLTAEVEIYVCIYIYIIDALQ